MKSRFLLEGKFIMNPEKLKQVQDPSVVEKELLDVVLGVAGDDGNMIREGVIKALRGIDDKARRTYLWNELTRRATEKLRQARRKAAV